ncbi:6-phosphogluconolactonase [Knoellia sp. 3-2P3]|uniref:6-phosphogluconolactonase n=1 Tax=unclassified Knoellia TaxID=2618719 RepID=UPI0023DADAB0|nr:6-phosphogluconolactonase [Knoellia sp. 3-2P3]MDF2091903.1 6-phosphogluconolactonase [Knoellia sp. 3-2P3]
MSRPPLVVVHRDKQVLADAAAARLVTAIVDAQASRGEADIVLTGGSMGSAILASLGASPACDAIDWSRVNLWWGDERYLPAGDPERNETQARAALLDEVGLEPARVHAMPASDGPEGARVEDAARRYAAELASEAELGEDVPRFDVVMLGVGPDAHVASLFPEHPALHDEEATAVAVHGSPKPPPTRISLTFRALCAARDVWFLVSGDDKAKAVGLALSGAGPRQAPAAGVSGTRSTTWLIDRAAATHVPRALVRISSP